MAKSSDILKELENIGALGGTAPVVAARRKIGVPASTAIKVPLAPVVTPEVSPLIIGFVEQLDILEGALQSMLEWCDKARSSLVEVGTPEEVPQVEEPVVPVPEAIKDAPVPEAVTEEVPPAETPPVEVPSEPRVSTRPKRSIAELRADFFNPDALTTSPLGRTEAVRDTVPNDS